MSFFDLDMDMCMDRDCHDLCYSTFGFLYTPPRSTIPTMTTTIATTTATSRPTARKLLFSEDDGDDCPMQQSNFSSPTCSDDEGDKDDELDEVGEGMFSQQQHKLSPFDLESAQYHELFNADLEEDDKNDDLFFTPIRISSRTPSPAAAAVVVDARRAQTPPTMSDNMATFLDTVNALRCKLAINSATPTRKQIDSAGLALYEEFGGKQGGGDISESSKQLLNLASLEAKLSTKKRSKKQFEDSLQGSKNYHCQLCNTVDTEFKTREGALLHFRNIHINFKPYYCRHGMCEQSFARRTDLRLHLIRKHEEQRPFVCKVPLCNKGFASACELKRHVPTDHDNLLVAMCSAESITKTLLLSCCHAPSKSRTSPSRKRTLSAPKTPPNTKKKQQSRRKDETSSEEEEDDFDETSDEEF